MPTVPTLIAFAIASTLLVIVPGPNVIYIVTRGIDQGRKAAFASALGVETATLIHIAAAMLGLSALVASSEIVFSSVKWAGAAYLVWMGIASIRSHRSAIEEPIASRRSSYRRLFRRGLIVNLLNPKVGLFFVAFLPQFIDPARGSSTLQILVMGTIMILIGIVSDFIYATGSGSIGAWLATHAKVARQRDRFAGVVYILLGVFAAISGSGSARKV